MKKTIKVPTRTGVVSVEAEVLGIWAVHKSIPFPGDEWDGRWTVTHVPTGRRARIYPRKRDAMAVAKALQLKHPKWMADKAIKWKLDESDPVYKRAKKRIVSSLNAADDAL